MKNNWEYQYDHLGEYNYGTVKDFIRIQISEVKKEIISEFTKGKRCFHCGKLKERGLSDWCGKCLEES